MIIISIKKDIQKMNVLVTVGGGEGWGGGGGDGVEGGGEEGRGEEGGGGVGGGRGEGGGTLNYCGQRSRKLNF